MKYLNLIAGVLFFNLALLNGCGLFEKKSPENQKSEKQIMQEQQDLKKKVDSLKNIRLDNQLDSLKIVLDSSSHKLNETMEKQMKSGELDNNKEQKTK